MCHALKHLKKGLTKRKFVDKLNIDSETGGGFMKKNFCVVFLSIGFVTLIFSQTRPFIGYDKVTWGSSVEDVRKAYNIGEEITLVENSGNDPNIVRINQKNVSDSISERSFHFNKWNSNGYRLYRVTVKYKDASDSAVRTLQGLLETRYGGVTNVDTERSANWYSLITIYGKFAPDIEVYIDHTKYYSGRENDLWVYYTWKKFRDEYQASKLDL
jgi:hypothetical protein